MKNIFRVIHQSEPQQVPSQKAEGGQVTKSTIVLQAFGGRFENVYVCTLFGNSATCKWYPGELVFASLRFQAHEYNGQWYQDIVVSEIVSTKK
ncbi:MAG: DUF3127 domain-containing protein [Bacteroidaceae bacterium]|nr:DUF3127 domain-containing protein [Bacteroidaceae bacterium]